ncbi:MAG: Fmu (Sun) domain-containing protein, partial [Chitinophagaceae bacterium]
ALSKLSVEDKIVAGLFLCSTQENEILTFLKPEWIYHAGLSIKDKLFLIDKDLVVQQIFPWKEECSEELHTELFIESFLQQPDLFLRIRPGNERQVKMNLKNAEIDFKSLGNSCLALSNNTKVDTVLEIDKVVVIQDYSSQRVAEFFPINIDGTIKTVWDCCAASGGKSILAKDVLTNIQLTVSDVRENILFNLKKRFAAAGINNYKSFIANLVDSKQFVTAESFDLIIADVPCSGSGTWSRTPEQLYYFEQPKIDEYAKLQKDILKNIVKALKPGSNLLYITCSVFKKENEGAIDFLKENFNFKVIKMELLKGYELKADSMFAALLQKQL